MEEDMEKKNKKQAHLYDTEGMVVTAWGNRFAYWRFDVKYVPDEIRLYALKGFIDDLQDCTTGIKKADYPKTPEGEDDYRLDCLKKRRELEAHINAGTRPARANASPEKAEDKAIAAKAKAEMKAETLTGLLLKKLTKPSEFTEADEAKMQEFLLRVAAENKKGKK